MLHKDLIEKFLRGECSDEQKTIVFEYLKQYPKAIDEWLSDKEWLQFTTQDELPTDVTEKMFISIRQKVFKKPLATVKKIGYTLLAAASVIILAVAGFKMFFGNEKAEQSVVINKVNNHQDKQLVLRVNTTNQRVHLQMEDSSIVELSPKSSIAFNKPFVVNGKRDIYLKGEAYFKVAKDKTKPFTVYSEMLATTALGTSFTIRSFKEESYIRVHLHTGKVVVKSAGVGKYKHIKNMYLLPDQILMFDKNAMLARVNRLDNKNNLVEVNTVSNNRLPNWFMFSNQPMTQVFGQLEEMYGVDIKYNVNDVSNMYVIGRFDKTDSIDNILKTIAKLNGLSVKRKGHTYTIIK